MKRAAGVPIGTVDRAESRNVCVLRITTDAAANRRTSFVGVDPELGGPLAAEPMSKFVPAGSKAGVVTGRPSAEEHRVKSQGG